MEKGKNCGTRLPQFIHCFSTIHDSKFTCSKSNWTILNKWHVISVTRSKEKNITNCWSNGEKLMTFTTGNIKGSNHCYIGDLGKIPGWSNTHFTGCIGEIIGFYSSLTDDKILYIHEYFIKKWGIKDKDLSRR